MIKPTISEMRPILTASSGPKPATLKQPKAAARDLPLIAPGGAPTRHQRAIASAQEYKFCPGHHDWARFHEFSPSTLVKGGSCLACVARREKATRVHKAAQLQAARDAYARKLAVDKAQSAKALEKLTGERLEGLPTPELLRRAIACSTNEPQTQAEMWASVLWHLQDREARLGEPAKLVYRARLIATIQT